MFFVCIRGNAVSLRFGKDRCGMKFMLRQNVAGKHDGIISRPVLVPLALFILGIIVFDALVPVFIVREHYSRHFDVAESFRYVVKERYKDRVNYEVYRAEVAEFYDGCSWRKTAGDVVLCLPKQDSLNLVYGTYVESDARMHRIRNFANSSFDYERYMRHKRLYNVVYAWKYKVSEGRRVGVRSVASDCNEFLKRRLYASALSRENAALSVSMLLGDKRELGDDLRLSFSVAGLSHILCVSGLHIGVLIGIFNVVLRFLHWTGKSGFYLRRFLLIAIAWAMAFLVGCTPSALRVALMLTIALTTGTTAYASDGLNVLAVACFVMLLFDPLILFDVGFQMSFLAVAGIMICMPRADCFIRKELCPPLRGVCGTAAVTLSAQLFVLPMVVWRFHNVPLFFLFANVLVVPFVGVVLFSIICLLVFASVPVLGEFAAWVLSGELWLLKQVAVQTDCLTRWFLNLL